MNIVSFKQLKDLLDNHYFGLERSGKHIGKRGLHLSSRKMISLNTICKIFKDLEKIDSGASFKDKQKVARCIKLMDIKANVSLKKATLVVRVIHFFRKFYNLFFDRDKILRPYLVTQDLEDKSILLETRVSKADLLKVEAAANLYEKSDKLWQKAKKIADHETGNKETKVFINLIEEELKAANLSFHEILQSKEVLTTLSISPELSKAIKFFVEELVQSAIKDKIENILTDIYLDIGNEIYVLNYVGKIDWWNEKNQAYIKHIINAFHDNGFSIRGIFANSSLRNFLRISNGVVFEVFSYYVMSHSALFKEKENKVNFNINDLNRIELVKEVLNLFDYIKKLRFNQPITIN